MANLANVCIPMELIVLDAGIDQCLINFPIMPVGTDINLCLPDGISYVLTVTGYGVQVDPVTGVTKNIRVFADISDLSIGKVEKLKDFLDKGESKRGSIDLSGEQPSENDVINQTEEQRLLDTIYSLKSTRHRTKMKWMLGEIGLDRLKNNSLFELFRIRGVLFKYILILESVLKKAKIKCSWMKELANDTAANRIRRSAWGQANLK